MASRTSCGVAEPPLLSGFVIFDLDVDRLRNRPGIKWGRHGADVLAAWVADMDVELAPVIVEAVSERLASGGLGYDFYDKPVPVIECFIRRMRETYGWETQADELIRLQDVIQGLQLAIGQLSDPGDGVVVQTPIYPPFLTSIEMVGRRIVNNPLVQTASGWDVDLDHLEHVFATESPALLLLCNPHNPCGKVFSAQEQADIASLATQYGVVVVADEIHLDLIYSPRHHVPFASLGPEAADCAVTLTAATKSFNMAGFRLAFCHTHSASIRERLDEVPTRLLGGTNILGQVATIAGWDHGQPWLDELVAGLDHNRQLLGQLLATHLPDVGYMPPEATYLAWLDCSKLGLGEDPAVAFLEHGVALNSGLMFGPGGEGHARLNFATSPEMLTQIVERMSTALP